MRTDVQREPTTTPDATALPVRHPLTLELFGEVVWTPDMSDEESSRRIREIVALYPYHRRSRAA